MLDGVDREKLTGVREALRSLGARTQLIGLQRGAVRASDGVELESVASVAASSIRYYDGLLIPDGTGGSRSTRMTTPWRSSSSSPRSAARLRPSAMVSACSWKRRSSAERASPASRPPQGSGARRRDLRDDFVVSDRSITTGRSDCDPAELCQAFSKDVEARSRELVDERSTESFPASDAHSGSTAVP